MKAVLLSIQPKYCELIASGKKTIEVRKTSPKIDTPFKCYIYCTIGNGVKGDYLVPSGIQCGKVIGEFVCNKIDGGYEYGKGSPLYGWHITDLKIYEKAKELSEFYTANWSLPCEHKKRGFNMDFCMAYENGSHFCKQLNCNKKRLTRPPKSWCYVENLGE